ncbi:MAG: LecA/PA-IL family lectin [Pyrinomonadaceae bacterium]
MPNLKKFLGLPVLILGLAVFAFGDTIRLKDGSIIKGKIISFQNGQFIVVVGSGDRERRLSFFSDEIATIEFDSNTETNAGTNSNAPGYTRTSDGKNTVITVGNAPERNQSDTNNDSSKNDSQPIVTTKPVITPIRTTPTTPPSKNNPLRREPIRIRSKVLADNTSNGWTNSGWVVRKGQRITISATGRISLGNGRFSPASGISSLPDTDKLIKDKPTGGLIAVIGDDNNDFIFVGDKTEFVAERDGALFLGVNEGNLNDNSGSYDVTIEVDLDISE